MRQDAMTSEQSMERGFGRRRWAWEIGTWLPSAAAMAAMLAMLVMTGCGGPERMPEPKVFPSPYPGVKLWAVMPFRDESGTSEVDGAAMADRLTQQLQQVEGVNVLPVNRVLEAMEERGLIIVDSAADAMELAAALGVDGLLVGTITAWDPYDPPRIGAAVQLYSPGRGGGSAGLDPRRLRGAATGGPVFDGPNGTDRGQPIAQAAGYFDAANGTVRKHLRLYAEGRAPIDSPAGWRAYVLNMDRYSEFVSHELMRRLFASEWDRLTKVEDGSGDPATERDAPGPRAPGSGIPR